MKQLKAKRDSGFSLISVIAMSSLAIILTILLTRGLIGAYQAQGRVAAMKDFELMQNALYLTISTPTLCKQAFRNTSGQADSLSFFSTTTDLTIPQFWSGQEALLIADQKMGKRLIVDKIYIRSSGVGDDLVTDFEGTERRRHFVTLFLQARTTNGPLKLKANPIRLSLLTDKVTDKVVGCSTNYL